MDIWHHITDPEWNKIGHFLAPIVNNLYKFRYSIIFGEEQ